MPLLLQIERVPSEILDLEIPITLEWLDASNQDIWQNLALTSIGGPVSSTLLILLAMPALYYAAVEIGFRLRAFYDWASSVCVWGAPEAEAA